jgi:hypothetical protein
MRLFTLGSKSTCSNNTWYSGTVLTPKTLKKTCRSNIGSLLVLMIFGLAMLMSSNMQAQHPYGFLDGNVVNTDDGKLDWQNVFTNSGLPAGSISTGIVFDGNAPDSIYTGGGTKDHLPINDPGDNASKSWQWKTADGSSSDKTNIQEAGAILIGGKIYFFGNKFAAEGTTTIGFWFFRDEVGAIANGRFSGEHQIGDILIVADIANGGAVGVIDAYKWVGAGNGTLPSSTKSMEKISTTSATLAAIVNANEEPTPWPHQSKGSIGPNLMPPITFFEGFLDLAELNLVNACFSSFLVETRSSNPVTSILEDFTFGAFNVQPDLDPIADLTICEGDTLGTLTAVANGGIPPLTYEWTVPTGASNPGNVASFVPDAAGLYSVRVIGIGIGNIGKCPSEPVSATVIINPAPVVTPATDSFCFEDQTDKSLSDYDSDVVAGTGYTVTWFSDPARTASASSTGGALAVGDHTFYATVTNDTTGCDSDTTLVITINADPVVTPATDSFCFEDQTDKSLSDYDSDVVAGTGYTVTWFSDPARTASASSTGGALAVGDHTFYATVTNDTTGCDSDTTLVITINPTPIVSIQQPPSDPLCSSDVPTGIIFKGSPIPGAGETGVWSGDVDEFGVFVPDLNEITQTIRYTFTDANGCTNYDEISFDYQNQPQGDTFFETLCVGEQIDLSLTYAPAGATNVEFSGEGVTIQGLFTGDTAKLYVVIVSFNFPGNICRITNSIQITVENCIIDEGCTPGFWKNHLEAWGDTDPEANFFEFFNIEATGNWVQDINSDMDLDANGSLTLLEALSAEVKTSKNSGWFAALARHAVAAYLNASYGLNYEFSTAYILSETEKVFEMDYQNRNAANAAAQALHTMFKTANERICPIGNSTVQAASLKISTADNTLSSVVVNSFSVSPVPFKETLNVKYDFDYSSSATIQMFDLQGRLLRTYNEANAFKGKVSQLNIDFRVQPNQVYILKVTTDRDVFNKKIISDK